MNQQGKQGQAQQAPPKKEMEELNLNTAGAPEKPFVFDEPQNPEPPKDDRRFISIIHRSSKHVLQFPTLMTQGALADMLTKWESDGTYLRGDLIIEQVDSPGRAQWLSVCETKSVRKSEDILIRGPFLAEPATAQQFLRDEAFKLLNPVFHDGNRGKKGPDGKPTKRAQEIEDAIDVRLANMCVIVATEEEIKKPIESEVKP